MNRALFVFYMDFRYTRSMDTEFSSRLLRIEKVLAEALPPHSSESWKTASFGSLPGAITGQHLEPLMAPCYTLLSLGGKRWRPLLLVLCAEMTARSLDAGSGAEKTVKGRTELAYRLVPLVEFVHTASLIHDDIEDSSDMRRGKPAAHITWGTDTALNAGAWLYFEAAVCLESPDIPQSQKCRLYSLYTRELRRLHLGQAMDIAWHRNPPHPSTGEYFFHGTVQDRNPRIARRAAGVLAGAVPTHGGRCCW